MSWTDPCGNCGSHRADCSCGDWNGYNKKKTIKELEDLLVFNSEDEKIELQKELNKLKK